MADRVSKPGSRSHRGTTPTTESGILIVCVLSSNAYMFQNLLCYRATGQPVTIISAYCFILLKDTEDNNVGDTKTDDEICVALCNQRLVRRQPLSVLLSLLIYVFEKRTMTMCKDERNQRMRCA